MFKKFFSGFMFAGLVSFVAFTSSITSFAIGDIYFVDKEKDLRTVISNVKESDYIILGNDIYLQKDLEIDNSITLDLNGNTIYILKDDASIIVGKKVVTKEAISGGKVQEYGMYSDNTQLIESQRRILLDGYGNIIKVDLEQNDEVDKDGLWNMPTVEVEYRDVISYIDDMDVSIINGKIIHCDGEKGLDGVQDTWIDFDGKDGKTPSEPIKMMSGILKLYDIAVYGGNGGDGGDGKYQALLHIPYGGGAGGNGGKGANGGNVIKFLREECKVFINDNTLIVPGKAGQGGDSGSVNPNWWLYKGLKGRDGKDGLNGQQIS